MKMSDLVKECNCKYCSWSNGDDPDSCTAWLVCKLNNCATDTNHCSKCKDRVPKYKNGIVSQKGGNNL